MELTLWTIWLMVSGRWCRCVGVRAIFSFSSRTVRRSLAICTIFGHGRYKQRKKGTVSIFDFFHSLLHPNYTFRLKLCSCAKMFRPLKCDILHIFALSDALSKIIPHWLGAHLLYTRTCTRWLGESISCFSCNFFVVPRTSGLGQSQEDASIDIAQQLKSLL